MRAATPAAARAAAIVGRITAAALALQLRLRHLQLVQRFLQLLPRGRQVFQQLHFFVEMNQKRQIAVRAQHLIEKALAGGALIVQHVALAGAGIQQPERQRQIGLPCEVANHLRVALFVQHELLLVQVLDDLALLVAHGGENVHHFYFARICRRRLYGRARRGWRLLPAQPVSSRKQRESGEQTPPGQVHSISLFVEYRCARCAAGYHRGARKDFGTCPKAAGRPPETPTTPGNQCNLAPLRNVYA